MVSARFFLEAAVSLIVQCHLNRNDDTNECGIDRVLARRGAAQQKGACSSIS